MAQYPYWSVRFLKIWNGTHHNFASFLPQTASPIVFLSVLPFRVLHLFLYA